MAVHRRTRAGAGHGTGERARQCGSPRSRADDAAVGPIAGASHRRRSAFEDRPADMGELLTARRFVRHLTRQGYRRNRELASVVDFFNHQESAPRKTRIRRSRFPRRGHADDPGVGTGARAMEGLRRGREGALACMAQHTAQLRTARTSARDVRRRAAAPNGKVLRSALANGPRTLGHTQNRQITVVTPFVGENAGPRDRVVDKLMDFPGARQAQRCLVVPGRPSVDDAKRMVVALPARFRDAWTAAWPVSAEDIVTFVVPPCRASEKVNRDLHAKALLGERRGNHDAAVRFEQFQPARHGGGCRERGSEPLLHRRSGSQAQRADAGEPPAGRSERDLCDAPIWPAEPELIDGKHPAPAIRCPPHSCGHSTTRKPIHSRWHLTCRSQLRPSGRCIRGNGRTMHRRWSTKALRRRCRRTAIGHRAAAGACRCEYLRAGDGLARRGWSESKRACFRFTSQEHERPALRRAIRSLHRSSDFRLPLSGQEPAEWVDALEQKREHIRIARPRALGADALRAYTGSYVTVTTAGWASRSPRWANGCSTRSATQRDDLSAQARSARTAVLTRRWCGMARGGAQRSLAWCDQPDVQPCRDQSDARACRSPDRRGAAAQHLRRGHRRNRRAVRRGRRAQRNRRFICEQVPARRPTQTEYEYCKAAARRRKAMADNGRFETVLRMEVPAPRKSAPTMARAAGERCSRSAELLDPAWHRAGPTRSAWVRPMWRWPWWLASDIRIAAGASRLSWMVPPTLATNGSVNGISSRQSAAWSRRSSIGSATNMFTTATTSSGIWRHRAARGRK